MSELDDFDGFHIGRDSEPFDSPHADDDDFDIDASGLGAEAKAKSPQLEDPLDAFEEDFDEEEELDDDIIAELEREVEETFGPVVETQQDAHAVETTMPVEIDYQYDIGGSLEFGDDENDELDELEDPIKALSGRAYLASINYAKELWHQRANCIGVETRVFYTERGESTKEPKVVCGGCEVVHECLEYAINARERHGIWGGMSERERRRIRRQRALARYDELGIKRPKQMNARLRHFVTELARLSLTPSTEVRHLINGDFENVRWSSGLKVLTTLRPFTVDENATILLDEFEKTFVSIVRPRANEVAALRKTFGTATDEIFARIGLPSAETFESLPEIGIDRSLLDGPIAFTRATPPPEIVISE